MFKDRAGCRDYKVQRGRGTPGATRPSRIYGVFPKGAVVAFDVPCPNGWIFAHDAVGKAIVGFGATRVGESGSPAPLPRQLEQGYDPYQPSARRREPGFISYDENSQPISRYVFGVTDVVPNYLPLYICKKT